MVLVLVITNVMVALGVSFGDYTFFKVIKMILIVC